MALLRKNYVWLLYILIHFVFFLLKVSKQYFVVFYEECLHILMFIGIQMSFQLWLIVSFNYFYVF